MKLTPLQVINKRNALQAARQNWLNHWQEIAQFMIPRKDIINTRTTPGEKRNVSLLDNTAMKSLELLAGALHGLLTNPNGFFFELTTGDMELDDDDNVRLWLQDASRRMHNVLNNSNFQTEVHELYLDLCGFGTAAMSIERDPEKIVRFKTHMIDTVYVSENNLGAIDTVFRDFKWTVHQIVGEFGEENVPEKILKLLKSPDESKKFNIIHAVYPKSHKSGGLGYISQYILEEEKAILKEGGFKEFPYVVPRWSKTAGEIYGRSPGMTALPEAKTLNKMTETVIKGAQKVVDPPLQVPDDGFMGAIRTRPGSINYYRAGSPDRVEPFANDARIDFGFQVMDQKRMSIKEAFFVDQLNLKEGPQMTATEVLQRTEESMRLLGPVLGRQQSEFLRPLIDRLFEMMVEQELFKPSPEKLDTKKLEVQYSSLIAKTQRVNEAQNIMRSFEAAGAFMQVDPTVADIFNLENAAKFVAKLYSAPQEVLRSKEEIEQIRQGRQQAQEEQAAAAEQAQEAETISKVAPAVKQLQG